MFNKTTIALIGLCFSLFITHTSCQDWNSQNKKEDVFANTGKSDTIKVLFTGDIMYHMPQVNAARISNNQFDFDPTWDALKPHIETVDIAVGNLETTLGKTGFSGYPCFCTPDTLTHTLKRVGFDVITTANNHAADRGETGIKHTIDKLNEVGIRTTGSFVNSEDRMQRMPLMVESKGIKIAFLAYTYGTNGIIVKKPYEVALIDTLQMKADIKKAQKLEADLICVLPHWGVESQIRPNPEQRRLARWLRQQGAHAIIGSHPHVCQPVEVDTIQPSDISNKTKEMELQKQKNSQIFPVYYSLGNLVSNQSQPNTQKGRLAILTIVKNSQGCRIISALWIDTFCYRRTLGKNHYLVVPESDQKDWEHRVNPNERK